MSNTNPTTAALLVSTHAGATRAMKKLSKCIANAKLAVTRIMLTNLYSDVRAQYAPAWW